MSEEITIDVREMQHVFLKVNAYLSKLPKKKDGTPEADGIQARLDASAQLWEKHFGIKVNAVWGTNIMTFNFKDKAAFTLFMLEWS